MKALLGALALLCAVGGVAQAQECEYPGVLVVLDRSASMQATIGGETKWNIARGAVSNMLGAHGDAAHFGLMLYPGPSGSGAGIVDANTSACRTNLSDANCEPLAPRCTTGEVVVDIAADTGNDIMDQMTWPVGLTHAYTPTWQSLEAANMYAPLHLQGRRNFVVLVTDGWQCCGYYEDAAGAHCEFTDRNASTDKVEALRESGVTVFVVGFGGSVDVASLQDMAVMAGTARPGCNPDLVDAGANNHCYYQASDDAELTGMLDDIVRQISEEVCDGRDNDCDGQVDEDVERMCASACGAGTEACFNGQWGECTAANPDAEICDGVDNNCDGQVDEDLNRSCGTVCGQGEETCVNGLWRDCDALAPTDEVCDGADNNCDGTVDEGCDCVEGDTQSCGDAVGICRVGTQTCLADGTWSDECVNGVSPQVEVCNAADDDCDGVVDGMARACQTACGAGEEICTDGMWGGCDAPDLLAEICNNFDDDCDGRVDEDLTRGCNSVCGVGVEMCRQGEWLECDAAQPAPSDICGNGLDDDCDGQIDESCDCDDGETQPCGTDDGVCSRGEQTCDHGVWGECEDETLGGAEVCDGLDNDCDGLVDEGGELCGDEQVCACGGCADPCQDGECGESAECRFGHCVEDHCPDGYICTDGLCAEGDRPVGVDAGGVAYTGDGGLDITGSSASSDCACRAGSGSESTGAAALILVLVAGVGLRRRRR